MCWIFSHVTRFNITSWKLFGSSYYFRGVGKKSEWNFCCRRCEDSWEDFFLMLFPSVVFLVLAFDNFLSGTKICWNSGWWLYFYFFSRHFSYSFNPVRRIWTPNTQAWKKFFNLLPWSKWICLQIPTVFQHHFEFVVRLLVLKSQYWHTKTFS